MALLAEDIQARWQRGEVDEALARARDAAAEFPRSPHVRGGPRFPGLYLGLLFEAERYDDVLAYLSDDADLLRGDFLWLDRIFRTKNEYGLVLRRQIWALALSAWPTDRRTFGTVLSAAIIARDVDHVRPVARRLEALLGEPGLDPQDGDGTLWCLLGDVASLTGDPGGAERCYGLARQRPGGAAWALAGLSALALDRGDGERAATLGACIAGELTQDSPAARFVEAATALWRGEAAVEDGLPTLEVVIFTHVATKLVRNVSLGAPGLGLIEETVNSLREHVLRGARVPITVCYDHRETPVAEAYLANLRDYCAREGLDLRVGVGNGLRRQWLEAFARRRADIVLIVEHDHLFVPGCPDAAAVLALLKQRPDIGYVRLNRRRNVQRMADRILIQTDRDAADGVTRTARFSNTPHFHRGIFFDRVILPIIRDNAVHDAKNSGAAGVEEGINRFLEKIERQLGLPFVLRALSSVIWGPPGAPESCIHRGV